MPESTTPDVKVAKSSGAFIWHSHEDADELFYVLSGEFTLEIEGADDVVMREGDIFVVPRGVRHRPSVKEGQEASVMMVEKKTVVNTGDMSGSSELTIDEVEDVRGK